MKNKTPMTITCSVWNYCQNNCRYCVSGSNDIRWDFQPGDDFKVFQPKKDLLESVNTHDYELRDRFGWDYYQDLHLSTNPEKPLLNAADLLHFPSLKKWLRRHFSDAHLHLSGGEPLLRPDIVEAVRSVCYDHEVTIVTNGQLIPQRKELLELPLKWLVAWHRHAISLEDFFSNMSLLSDKKHMVVSVFDKDHSATELDVLKELYVKVPDIEKYNIEFRIDRNAQTNLEFQCREADIDSIATETLMFVDPCGKVYPCNSKTRGEVGNIYTGDYNLEKAERMNPWCRNCVLANGCAAYQTAVKMHEL